MVRTSSKLGEFWLWSWIWPWRSRSIAPQNNRDLNQGLLHLWSKFGDPSLNGSRVIARTSKWLTHRQTDTHTQTQTQATTIPEGQNWPRVKMWIEGSFSGDHLRHRTSSICSRLFTTFQGHVKIGCLWPHSPTCHGGWSRLRTRWYDQYARC